MCNRKWACLIKHLAKNSGRGSEVNISIKEKEEEADHRKNAGIRSRKARCPGSGENPARSQDGKGVNRGKWPTVGASHSLAGHSQAPTSSLKSSAPSLPEAQIWGPPRVLYHTRGPHGFCPKPSHTLPSFLMDHTAPLILQMVFLPIPLPSQSVYVPGPSSSFQRSPCYSWRGAPLTSCVRVGLTLCFRRPLS